MLVCHQQRHGNVKVAVHRAPALARAAAVGIDAPFHQRRLVGAVSRTGAHDVEQLVEKGSCLAVITRHDHSQQHAVAGAFRHGGVLWIENHHGATATVLYAVGFPLVVLFLNDRVLGALALHRRLDAGDIRCQLGAERIRDAGLGRCAVRLVARYGRTAGFGFGTATTAAASR